MAVQLANAESKCRELAAENAAIKAMKDCLSEELRGYESDGAFEGPKMHLLWWKTETPATDAFLAEVRASTIPDEATERDLFEEWVMENVYISKSTLEGLRTDGGYRNSTLSGRDYNGMWSQWKALRAAQLRKGAAL